MSNRDDDQFNHANEAALSGDNVGYYSQGRAATEAGGNRMAEGLQDTTGLTQLANSSEEALAATFDSDTGRDTNEDTRATGQQHDVPSGDVEGTYVGFADADTVPGNVEGWAGADNLGDTDDRS
ncbi:MAG: hypothetical protein QOH93_2328 [Chloroflexia bacterium]|jgi:hypothetical protein|nr:hypothetical protein [Chloroflexia bacterium]